MSSARTSTSCLAQISSFPQTLNLSKICSRWSIRITREGYRFPRGRPYLVTYPIWRLHVLLKSKYLTAVRRNRPELVGQHTDLGFARVSCEFAEPVIGLIARTCQRWINTCFPIVYTLKGMCKARKGPGASVLEEGVLSYRALTFHLLRSLTIELGLATPDVAARWRTEIPTPSALPSLSNRPQTCLTQAEQLSETIFREYLQTYRASLVAIDERIRIALGNEETWQKVYRTWCSNPAVSSDTERLQ